METSHKKVGGFSIDRVIGKRYNSNEVRNMITELQRYIYTIENEKVCITACYEGGTSVEIPEMIDGYPVTEIAPYTFSASQTADGRIGGNQLEEVILPKTVTKVGKYAFYNCKKLRRIEFWNVLVDLGAGAFTGCHSVREIGLHFIGNKKSRLREFLLELPEEQTVEFFFEDGYAKVLFPEFYEEAIENTPARNLSVDTHGSGMIYRNCIVAKELDFKLYDEKLHLAFGPSFDHTLFRLSLQRLLVPYQLTESAKERYVKYLKDHLQAVSQWVAREQLEEEMFLLEELCVETSEEMEWLIAAASVCKDVAMLSHLMDRKRKKFGVKRKVFEL